jgi:hypothetical protein
MSVSPEPVASPRASLPPQALIEQVQRLGRRAWLLSVIYGLGIAILLACGLLVLGAIADFLLRLPGLPRLIGLFAAVGLLAWVVYDQVIKPARTRASSGDVAGHLEEAFPQFEDRLRSGLAWVGPDGGVPQDALRRQTLTEAGELAAGVRFGDILRVRQPVLAAGGAISAVLILLILAALLGPLAGTILGRLIDPLNPNHQWPKRFAVTPSVLPEIHPAGRPLTVSAELTKGDPDRASPTIVWQLGSGPERRVLMNQRPDGTFAATLSPDLAQDADRGRLRVWIEAGDDRAGPQIIDLVTRPTLQFAVATVQPPPYVGEAFARQRTLDLGQGPAVVGQGSDVRLELTFSKPLAVDATTGGPKVRLVEPGGEVVPLDWQQVEPGVVVAQTSADETLRFGVEATGIDGFGAELSPTYELVVRPDRLPDVRIEQPRRNESRTAEATVPLEVVAEDDFGFEAVELIVEKLVPAGQTGWTASVPLLDGEADSMVEPTGADGGVRLRLDYDWILAQVGEGDLVPGDVLEFHVRAQDNFELDGAYHEPVESGRLRITIISQQELNRRAVRELQRVRDGVESARRRQDATARETAEFRDATAEREVLDEADIEAGRRLSRQQSSSAAQAKRLAETAREVERMLEENRAEATDLQALADAVARQLDRTAEGPMRDASTNLDRVANELAESSEARDEAAQAANEDQAEASRRLAEVAREMERIGSLRQTVDAMRALLEAQRELSRESEEALAQTRGRETSDLSDEERERLGELADEQERLADEVGEATQRMEEQAEQMGDEAAAEAMRQAARTAREQQVRQNQQQAARQQRQNQARQSRQSREQAEIGLRLVLDALEQAEREQMRRLQRQLADLVEQLERLVRRQAGHNLDNLVLRDIEDGLDELRVVADREADVEPSADRLSAGQEQTERNTRDLARPAEEVPEGSELAATLARAAGRMERAAVFLRADDLAAAYEPPQIQALDALREALDAAREQQEQVEQEMAQRQRDAVRDRLVSLRDAQANDVNAPTVQHELAREAGELNRRERNRPIVEIKPRQDELALEMEAIEAALAEVGGRTFVYAGSRVRTRMNDVSAALGERDTSAPVQRDQRRIVRDLQRMIDALEIEASQERFEQNDSGGGGEGGGEQGPTLPPVAELKLLRLLQEQLNDDTIDLHDLAPDDLPDRALELADEQGELRRVADEMLRQYSRGQMRLGPEPDPETLLPGEAEGDVEQQLDDRDLIDDLLGDAARAEPEAGEEVQPAGGGDAVRRLGDYAARSRQRLDLQDDPGPVTQAVQARILVAIDDLIEEAQQSQSQSQGGGSSSSQQPSGSRDTEQEPQPGQQQANAGGQPGEQQSGNEQNGNGDREGDPPAGQEARLSGDLDETMAGWGDLTPRERQAILEGATDRPVDLYRELTEAFYKRLNERDD